MRFLREIAALGSRQGGLVAGLASTALGLIVFLLSRSLPWALAVTLALLFLSMLLASHELWKQRNAAEEALGEIEQRPGERIDSALRQALELREELTYKAELLTPQEQRVKTAKLITASRMAVSECAPAYFDDLKTETVDGAGTTHLIGVVNEYYGLLATVRKDLS